MSQVKKKFNDVKWSLIVATIGTIGTVLTVPEIRKITGLVTDNSASSQKEVHINIYTEAGEALAGVKVVFMAKGAPETQYTDSNGYAKVKIASIGDVRINLSKSGYPVQNFNINLANEQDTNRTIRLSKTGQPEVQSSTTTPGDAAATSISALVAFAQPSKEILWTETASSLIGNIGRDFTYTCPQNGTVGDIWGTDFYTSNSSICSAAVHAGVINARDGGKFQIRIRPGEEFYNGTSRYGVTSDRYGQHKGSFMFLNAVARSAPSEQVEIIEWNETASKLNGKLDQDFTYKCPQNGTVSSDVQGTDIYTSGSSICSAAVHAGIITARNGGKVRITIIQGEKFYNPSKRNGVVSNRYESYPWSFKFMRGV
jgi:LCCL domain